MERRIERHRRASEGFAAVAEGAEAAEAWSRPSPCAGWTARDVVEHVIGFHEVLVLRPLGVKVERPREGPAARWRATERALFEEAFSQSTPEIERLLPMLTTDVLIHTWDLARALDLPVELDADLCHRAYAHVSRAPDAIASSGMYDPPVAGAHDAPVVERLLSLLGRDPAWSPPAGDPVSTSTSG